MNVIEDLIIKQACQDNFTKEQLTLLKESQKSNYELYLLYKKIYSGQYETERQEHMFKT